MAPVPTQETSASRSFKFPTLSNMGIELKLKSKNPRSVVPHLLLQICALRPQSLSFV